MFATATSVLFQVWVVVNVYDTFYSSVTDATVNVIASLVFSSASTLTVRMMDVMRQVKISQTVAFFP